ncbi:hypothetical protein D3C80_2135210 [compost metagenome]
MYAGVNACRLVNCETTRENGGSSDSRYISAAPATTASTCRSADSAGWRMRTTSTSANSRFSSHCGCSRPTKNRYSLAMK